MVLGLVYIVRSIICFYVCIFCTCGTGINFLALSIRTYFISNKEYKVHYKEAIGTENMIKPENLSTRQKDM